MIDATLIVFAREPIAGQSKTRLARLIGAGAAAKLARAFALDTLTKARLLKPRRLVIAGGAPGGALNSRYFRRLARAFRAELRDQGSGGLGARMAAALVPYARRGAILIGTDCPSLPAGLLAQSAALLRPGRVVLGPSLDGGYYLIGVRGGLPPIFTGIKWGRGDTLARTLKRLELERCAFSLGPAWYDIDRRRDLALLAAHLRLIEIGLPRAVRAQVRGNAPASHPCPHTARAIARLGLLHAGG